MKLGTSHRKPPPFASSYPAEVEVDGLGVTVPRHATLRQVVPFDAVQDAERLERKVVHAEVRPYLMAVPLVLVAAETA